MKYLVAVERPSYDDDSIKVTDDCDGLGPGVLATYPIGQIEAESPLDAARQYVEKHGLPLPITIVVNMSDEYGEWMMDEGGAHEV